MYDDSIPVEVVGAIAVIAFFTGAWAGVWADSMAVNHDRNTRECTIACPGNVESIKSGDDCYCKLEGK